MIDKQQIKDEIENIKEEDLTIIYRIIKALAKTTPDDLPPNHDEKALNESCIQFLDKMYGCLSDDPIKRGEQGEFEIREIIE